MSLYRSSILLLLIITGITCLIQIEFGNFNLYLFQYPINLYTAAALIIASAIGGFFLPRSKPIQFLSSLPFAVTLFCALLILGIIMGLTPQKNTHIMGNILSMIGFSHMTKSWPFVTLYALTLLSLGLLIARRLRQLTPFSISFHLNHIGLWLLLMAAGLGYADRHRFVMYPELNQGPIATIYNANGDPINLPIGLELNKFSMETYPAKVAIYSKQLDAAIPASNPAFFQLEAGATDITIEHWQIKVKTYLHEAAPDSKNGFRYWPVIGSAPAAEVSVRNLTTNETKEGWISSGSVKGQAQPFTTLPLDENHTLLMLRPEPKHFVSDITIYTPDQEPVRAHLTVNNPITVGDWKLYQQGYDENAGAFSIYSAIELVYDPWIKLVYFGFGLLALGALGMIWSGRKGDQT